MAIQRRRSRQASAITGRKREVVSPFMPRMPSYKPKPELLEEPRFPAFTGAAPTPLPKKRIESPGPGTAADMGPDTGPHAGGKGLGLAHAVSDVAVGSSLARMAGSVLGPWGALAGMVAPPVARGLAFGETMGRGEDLGPADVEALGWAEATQADIDMRGLGVNTYAGETETGGYDGGWGAESGYGGTSEGIGVW